MSAMPPVTNVRERRRLQCHKETQEALEVKGREPARAWGEVPGEAEAEALAGTAFARAVVNRFPMSGASPALRKNVPSAELL